MIIPCKTITITPGIFDVKSFLSRFVPGTNHEAIPHGVPIGYAWREHSTRCIWPGSSDAGCTTNDYQYGNWWGVVYVDTTDYHASNTRVNVWKDVKMLYLYNGDTQWRLVQRSLNNTSAWGGAGYPEDWTGTNTAINKRIEPDESISYVPRLGYVSHFYPPMPWANVLLNRKVHCVVIAHTRLILANLNEIDDRSQSKYIIHFGGDNRRASADQSGVQRGFCAGLMIKPKNTWRTVVGSTLSLNNLNTLPMPPAELFRMPDGAFPT